MLRYALASQGEIPYYLTCIICLTIISSSVSDRLAHTEEEAQPSQRSDYDNHAWRVFANVHEKVGTTTCTAIKDHGPRYGITDNKRAPISSANAVRLYLQFHAPGEGIDKLGSCL